MARVCRAITFGIMMIVTTWVSLTFLEAQITQMRCKQLNGLVVDGKCISQLEAYRSIERWPNWGGWGEKK